MSPSSSCSCCTDERYCCNRLSPVARVPDPSETTGDPAEIRLVSGAGDPAETRLVSCTGGPGEIRLVFGTGGPCEIRLRTGAGDPGLIRLVSGAACLSPREWKPDSELEISVLTGATAGMLGLHAELSFTDDCHSSTT